MADDRSNNVFDLRWTTLMKLWIAVAFLGGCGDTEKIAPRPPMPVRTQTVAAVSRAATVMLTGDVRAHVQSDLGFRSSGRIVSRSVEIGDHVTAGQTLAALDTAELKADVASSKAAMESAEASLKLATVTFERQEKLIDKGFTTRTTYDNAKKDIVSAQASLDGAKANFATAEEKISQANLVADGPGIITAREAEVGQVVQSAQTVFSMARDGGRDAVFDVYESLIATKPPDGSTIEIALLSDTSVIAKGRIREIGPAVDPATDTVRVKIAIDDAPETMALGSAVSGIGHFQARDVVVLPWTALFKTGTKAAVWVVDPQTMKVSVKPIAVSNYRTGELWVSDGLKPGDVVVTTGVQLLRPGQVVTLADGSNPASAESGK